MKLCKLNNKIVTKTHILAKISICNLQTCVKLLQIKYQRLLNVLKNFLDSEPTQSAFFESVFEE